MAKKKYTNARPANYRKKALSELKAKYPYYNLKSNLFIGVPFLGGLFLTIWEINIYRVTFISVYILLSIWVLTGVLITPLFRKTFNIYCFNPYTPERSPLFFHFLFNIVSFGGIVIFLFMWTNQTLNDHIKIVKELPVVSSGHLAKSRHSCGDPYVNVIYKNQEKQLVFPCGTEIENYNNVYVEITKGLFGFDVITNQTLVEGDW
ncbi:hypothetical protein F0919_13505 [Taibaiella lutea]|uniref:Uncharacterized protein n=1 Tax=Taibaiella lutea TaxID=2608001 RepID=A0A5M6CEL0_9BACT|nr:hypothetical protein [Taibaiella lutea]KAA5533551.1 hypothetical protein F0919_13505 [Taibaiella lutea]